MRNQRTNRQLRGLMFVAAWGAAILTLGGGSALAQEDGARVFNQCKACHTLDAGVNRVGPSLAGLDGRTAGTVEGFRYSDAMKDSGIVWNEETLEGFLANPREYLPGNRMSFPGVRDEEKLEALIDYLLEASGG